MARVAKIIRTREIRRVPTCNGMKWQWVEKSTNTGKVLAILLSETDKRDLDNQIIGWQKQEREIGGIV